MNLFLLKRLDDREEFQHGNISKKEVYDLFAEFGDIDMNSWDLYYDLPDPLLPDSAPSKQVDADENLNENLVTPVKQINESSVTTHENSQLQEQTVSKLQPNESSPMLANNQSINFFEISTSGKPNFKNNTISSGHHDSSLPQTQISHSINGYSLNPLQDSAMKFAGSSSSYSALPYTQVLVALSPQAITRTSPMLSTMTSSTPLKITHQIVNQRQVEDKSAQRSKRSKRSQLKCEAYKELERIHPDAIEPQVKEI